LKETYRFEFSKLPLGRDMSSALQEFGSAKPTAAAAPPTILEVRVVTGTGGGPEKTILNSPRFLDPHGFRTICAYMHPPGDRGFEVLRRRGQSLGAQLVSVPDRGPFDLSVIRNLIRLCREEQVAVWHGHDYKSNFLGLWARRSWPMRLMSTVHGWGVRHWKSPLFDAIDLWSLRFYDRVICVSDDLAETCLRSGIRQDRVRLIENGIDVEQFQRRQSIESARRQLGWPENGACIGAIGRLSDEKGFDLLIEAVKRLKPRHPDLRLVIAGEGPSRAALEQQINSAGLSDGVLLLGMCEDVRTLLEAVDVFVLSSRREGLPNVVLEAMAMEVPVVATRVAGVPHVIADGVNGLLAQTESVESLVTAIERCLSDAGLRKALAQAARDTVVRRFNFAVRMDRMRKIYEELLRPREPVAED
jgi:glycosyltransferase involved in cell wall biosynthesis